MEHLEAAGVGRKIYVGGYIQAEVMHRGLPLTAEYEQIVRDDMRRRFGRDIFARQRRSRSRRARSRRARSSRCCLRP